MKKYLFGTFAIAMAVCFSAFTTKPPTLTGFFYDPGNSKIYIPAGNNATSIVETQITSEASWEGNAVLMAQSDNLAQIEFVLEDVADGGNDGELTLKEAIDALWAYYVGHTNTLPSEGNSFPVATGSGSTPADVVVHRKQ